jgi:SAM-dependent methyltransferase
MAETPTGGNSQTQFIDALLSAFQEGRLIKCTLSKPLPAAAPELKNVYIRPVELKKGLHLSFNHRYKTRDEVKNLNADEARNLLGEWLNTWFAHATLFTSSGDYYFSSDASGARIQKKPASQKAVSSQSHDRQKNRRLDPAAPWLHALGITSSKGQVLAAAQDKWKQINKYLEIIEGLLRARPLPANALIADMGSGKGYLTFALYDFLVNKMEMQPRVVGIELRQKLVDFCNKVAAENNFASLSFLAKDINEFAEQKIDMLIALHACDTATDLALAAGVKADAQLIVAAPCCHKQIRKEMDTQNEMAPVLRHGILEERQAELITDGIRALLLESKGYDTKVFEFVSSEHTAKNLMITATAGARPKAEALERIEALKQGFGIQTHYLETLL